MRAVAGGAQLRKRVPFASLRFRAQLKPAAGTLDLTQHI